MKNEKTLIPEKSKSHQLKDAAEQHLKKITVNYFKEAKDDSFVADRILSRYDRQWKQYCHIVNKRQKDIKIFPDAFKKRIQFVLDIVEKQKESEIDDIKPEGPGTEDKVPSTKAESLSR